MGKLGEKRRKAVRKRWERKSRKKKPDTCLLADESAVPIVHEVHAAIEDSASALEPVNFAVVSPKHSGGSWESESCLITDKLTEEPILCNAQAAFEEAAFTFKPIHGAVASPKVHLEATQTKLEVESISSSNILIQSASTIQFADVVPFKVSEIELLETSTENCLETSCESGLEARITPATVSPPKTKPIHLEELRTRLKHSLPPNWCQFGCPVDDDAIVLFQRSAGPVYLLQRQISVFDNGTVNLFVHGKPLSRNHKIWAQFPQKISLATHSTYASYLYVLAVVKLVHSYDMCPGCPLPQDQDMAKKMGAVFSPNTFRERKYVTTHRSVDCDILVVAVTKSTACTACKNMQRNIRRRLARKIDF